MIKKLSKKAIYIMLLIITLMSSFQGIVSATEISNAFIQYSHDCGYHLQYWHNNQWTYVITSYVEYTAPNGNKYPAYCLNSDRAGVSASLDYSVSISSVLDDDRIWRVITHGYPYDNMGLNNDDAFVATKHAVYSIINNRDVRSYYHGGDTRGEAIVDKIEYLTNIGRYGTQTQSSANTFGTKIGGFTQFNDTYYAQEYSVSSNIEMSSYTITAIAGFPHNSYIGDVNGNAKTSFSAGEHFKVFVPKSEIKSNFSGTIALQSKCKTFPVFYGNTPSADLQNYAVCYDPYGDVQGITKLDVDVYKSTVKVHKVDKETKESIEGITFNAKYKDTGENIGDFKTDKNGNITINRLRPGTIVLTETASTKHYILNTTEFDVSVEFGDTKEIEISNQHKKGNLRVFKVDKDNNRIALGNVEFDLYSEEYQKVIGTYRTNVDGEIYVENLRTGDYKWIEKNTNKWYNLKTDATEIEVEWNKTNDSIIENELKKGSIRVIKIDEDDNTIRIPNVTFEVLDKDNNLLEKITTNENGEAKTKEYAIRDYEQLKIHEIETDQWYVLNDETKTVKLEANQIKDITFTNEKKKGQIRVIKVDMDNKEVLLEGVTFDVLDEQGKVVDTITTGKDGTATTKRLPIDQKYTVLEKSTLQNYVLTAETQTVRLEQDQIKDITFENEKKKGQVRVIKVDMDDNEVLLEGVTFDVLDEQGKVVDTITTGKDGTATTKRLPIDQKYTVLEKSTLQNYVLTEETQTVTLEQDQIKDITFENEKIKGYIEITKISEDDNKYNGVAAGTPLEGAIFDVYDSKNNIVDTVTTGKDGKATTKLLIKGEYTVKEKSTGSIFYLLNENKYKVEIKEHKETVPVTITNKSVKISVSVEKTGYIETQKNDTIKYDFSNVANTSNIYLDNFKWKDYLPTDYIRLSEIVTGTWNQDITYSITYKTNLNTEERVLADNLSSKENHKINCTNIGLQDGEYITEYSFNFGRVDVGFKEEIAPSIFCKVLDTVQNKDTFTNKTETTGEYEDLTDKDEDEWTTVVYEKDVHAKKLPKTGK